MKRKLTRWLASLAASLALGGAVSAQEGNNPEELFKTLDKNGDGILKASEIGEERGRFFDRIVRVGDKDGNGELTREEFLAGVKQEERPADRPAGDRPAGDRPGAGQADGRRFFERFDSNKDGKVTKDEVPQEFRDRLNPVFERLGKDSITQEEFLRAMAQFAGRPGEGGRPNAGQIEEMFRRADANNDGKLTLDEAPEQARRMLEPIFRRLNREGKDGVTREELTRAMQDGAGRPAEGRPGEPRPGEARPGEGRPGEGRGPMPRIFQMADLNGDGRVSKEELAKLSEKFGELDENKDGQLDPRELLGPPPRDGDRRPEGERRPEATNRPEGDSKPAESKPAESKPAEGTPARRPAGRPQGGEFLNEIFTRLDKNKDGQIGRDEAENRIKEHFDEMDANKDGTLSREEIQRGMARRLQEGRPANRPEGPRPDGEKKPEERPAEEKKPE